MFERAHVLTCVAAAAVVLFGVCIRRLVCISAFPIHEQSGASFNYLGCKHPDRRLQKRNDQSEVETRRRPELSLELCKTNAMN